MKFRAKATIAALGAVAAPMALSAAPAYAGVHHAPAPQQLHVTKTLSSAYIAPLQFAVAGSEVFVADSATSTLNRLDANGHNTVIAHGPSPSTGGDLAGVGVDQRHHALAYTSSTGDHSTTTLTILKSGAKPVVADLSGFEKTHNPDGKITYGITQPLTPAVKACVLPSLVAGGVPGAAQGHVSYTGQVDSHPYAVASLGDGSWAVADAGGNDIVRVNRWGQVSLIAVLPAQPQKITQAIVKENGLPSCALGLTYRSEAVPTDVEVGPGGALYVTTLPGGISGTPGSVYRVSRWGGYPQKIATGFQGATNLAIDPWGGIYVAELDGGTISKVVGGKPVTVLTLPGVVADEWANGHLYASTAPAAASEGGGSTPPPPGTIVELGPVGRS
jgi:hypothetical protein